MRYALTTLFLAACSASCGAPDHMSGMPHATAALTSNQRLCVPAEAIGPFMWPVDSSPGLDLQQTGLDVQGDPVWRLTVAPGQDKAWVLLATSLLLLDGKHWTALALDAGADAGPGVVSGGDLWLGVSAYDPALQRWSWGQADADCARSLAGLATIENDPEASDGRSYVVLMLLGEGATFDFGRCYWYNDGGGA